MKFITIGVFSTAVNYTIFYITYQFLSVHYVISSAVGFIVGVFAGHGLNKNWTFAVKEKTHVYIYKYYLVYGFSLILSLVFLRFLVGVLSIVPEVASVVIIGLSTCTNFIGTKFWVFRK